MWWKIHNTNDQIILTYFKKPNFIYFGCALIPSPVKIIGFPFRSPLITLKIKIVTTDIFPNPGEMTLSKTCR